MGITENWDQLTPDEKYEERFKSFIAAEGIEFASKEAEEKYKKHAQMLKDVVELKKPERVPVAPNIGFYPAEYAGITAKEAMYDYEKLGMAWKKFSKDFDFDFLNSCAIVGSGPLYEKLDFKMYRWPGNGTNDNTPYQCVEKEYMKSDEYDKFINDPSGYFMRYYLPRIFGALEPWKKLSPFTYITELPFVGSTMIPVGLPDVQESFQKFMEAGQEALKWIQAVGEIDGETTAKMGLPSTMAGFSKAPFDNIGDTMRGTTNIMLDMYRRPEKIFEAMDAMVPMLIEMGVGAANANNNPFVMIPIHKGADSFMSRDDFMKFYWPSFEKVLLGLIEEGCVPFVFVEGSYNQRIDLIADSKLPAGKSYWLFDKTDMVEVKKHFGGKFAFGGNVPGSLLKTGTVEKVEKYVRNLIENVAGDGGYILTAGAVIDVAEPELLHAMIDAGKKYGKY